MGETQSTIYWTVVVLFLFQRIGEMILSKRNDKILFAQGYQIFFASDLPWLKLFHASWFVCQSLEHFYRPLAIPTYLWWLAMVLCCIGQVLRFLSQQSLKQRWVISIMSHPLERRINDGIYRWLDHPNYLGVFLEIIFLPLMGGAIVTSLVFGLVNVFILKRRMGQEKEVLQPLQAGPGHG